MKKPLNEEFKRMQKLAGILNENELDESISSAIKGLFGKSKPKPNPDQSKGEEVVPFKSTNPNHQLHQDGETFHFGISDFAKFVTFCKEKKIYDLILKASDDDKALLGNNTKNEAAWKKDFIDKDGDFNISFGGSIASGGSGKDEIWYAKSDAYNATDYPLAVYDEKLKKYVEW